MRRREFITLIGGAAAIWPLATRAQQPAMPVIGYLDSVRLASTARVTAFRQALSETGYVEGQNVAIEYRSADNQFARLPSLADELVGRQVAVIFAPSVRAALAAKAATTTIPIVFISSADPVESGLVASLNKPGGNLTGVVTLNVEVGPKRLELLHEVVPRATIIALLVNPTNPTTETQSKALQAAAQTLGLQLHVLHAGTESDFDAAFANLVQVRAGALVIGIDTFLGNQSELLAVLTVRHALPTISSFRQFAAAGGLMSYGGSSTDAYRRLGVYTGRILKGEKPANLPVVQSTKFEFVINLKTAKVIGLTVPPNVLALADEVIE